MSRNLAMTIIALATLSACGGGGTAPVTPDPIDRLAEFSSLYHNAEGLDYTELSDARLTGSYHYAGYVGMTRIGGASSLSLGDLERAVSDLEPEDLIERPQVTGRFTMTANFDRNEVSGRLGEFERANGTAVSGEIRLKDGRIDDGYFHYNAELSGSYNGRTISSSLLAGDFLGDRAEAADGAIAFQTPGDAMVGVFVGARD